MAGGTVPSSLFTTSPSVPTLGRPPHAMVVPPYTRKPVSPDHSLLIN